MMSRPIIATELLKGQGLGNQLFCYITTRALAYQKEYDFSILNRELFSCLDFLDLDLGIDCSKEYFENILYEKEERMFIGNSIHDIEHGCYITGCDEALLNISGSTLIYGNMQDEVYFSKCKDLIKDWLKVKPEYDCKDYSKENICIINIRGGEYTSNPDLFLRRSYWINAINYMKTIREDMEFIIITDDVNAANRVLPEYKAYHFDIAGDYTIIKNAHYLIVSNSSFAFFPSYTSDTIKMIIAPKYWARHNVSDGYWASEQNIYSNMLYMDKRGSIFNAQECRKELEEYKAKSPRIRKIGKKLTGVSLLFAKLNAKKLIYVDLVVRAIRSLKRRVLRTYGD